MEHSKEFLINSFLQENGYEHVELNTIKSIIHMYKVLKHLNKDYKDKQMLRSFKTFIVNNELNNNISLPDEPKTLAKNLILLRLENQQQRKFSSTPTDTHSNSVSDNILPVPL